MIDEFKASRREESTQVFFSDADSKMEKIAHAFLQEFSKLSHHCICFLEHMYIFNEHLMKCKNTELVEKGEGVEAMKRAGSESSDEDSFSDDLEAKENNGVNGLSSPTRDSGIEGEIRKARGRPSKTSKN